MEVIYGLIPSMIIIGIILVIVLFWAIKSGQFDDLEGDAHRILMDEDLMPQKKTAKSDVKNEQEQNNIPEQADKNKKCD